MLDRAELEAKIAELEKRAEEYGVSVDSLKEMDKFEGIIEEAKTTGQIRLHHFIQRDTLKPLLFSNQQVARLCRALLSPELSHLTFLHLGNQQLGVRQLTVLCSVLAIHPNLKQLIVSMKDPQGAACPWDELRSLISTSKTLEKIGIASELISNFYCEASSFHRFMQEAAAIHHRATAIYIYTDAASPIHDIPSACVLPERKAEFSICMDFSYKDLMGSLRMHPTLSLDLLTLAFANIALRDHENIDVLSLAETEQPLQMMGPINRGPISIISDYVHDPYLYRYTYIWSPHERDSKILLDKNSPPEIIASLFLTAKPTRWEIDSTFIMQLLESPRIKTFFQGMDRSSQMKYFSLLADFHRALDYDSPHPTTYSTMYLLEHARVALQLEQLEVDQKGLVEALDTTRMCLKSIFDCDEESIFSRWHPIMWISRLASSPDQLDDIIKIAKNFLLNYINDIHLSHHQDASNALRICALLSNLCIGHFRLNDIHRYREREEFRRQHSDLIHTCQQLEEEAKKIENDPKAYQLRHNEAHPELAYNQLEEEFDEDTLEIDREEAQIEDPSLPTTTGQSPLIPPPQEGKEEKVTTAEEETKEVKAEVKENQRAASSTDTRKKELDAKRNQHWQMWTPPDSSRTSTSSSSSSSSHTPPPPSHDKKPH